VQYNPRQHQYTSSLNDEIGGYGGYEEQEVVTPRNRHRPARNLRNTQQAIIAERLARQQAIDEARARQQEKLTNARQNRTTRNPASARRRAYTPANRAYRDDEEDIDGNGDAWPPQGVRSAICYAPGQYIQGDTQWNVKDERISRSQGDKRPDLAIL
jgi:regulator of protease activity HflC (stomatin/prohibitin superfamily)